MRELLRGWDRERDGQRFDERAVERWPLFLKNRSSPQVGCLGQAGGVKKKWYCVVVMILIVVMMMMFRFYDKRFHHLVKSCPFLLSTPELCITIKETRNTTNKMNRNSQTNNHSKQQSSQCKKKPGCRQLVSLSPFPQPLLFFGLSERFFFREASNGNLILKLRAGNWSVVVATKIVGQVWFHTSSLSCYSFCHFFYCTQFSLSFDLHWVCFEICNIVVGKWISNGRLISSSGINSPRQLKLDLVGWVGWIF